MSRFDYYNLFINDKKFIENITPGDRKSFEYKELLLACYNTENYDEDYKINKYEGKLPSFKKELTKHSANKSSIEKNKNRKKR